jgi:histidyl-tRNA synthetase
LRTVFEVVSPELGEDTVICGGGRYDRLVADLGGAQVPGIGFAIGEDRLVEVLPDGFRRRLLERPVVAVLPIGEPAVPAALSLSRALALAGVAAPSEVTGRSLKAGLKWAGKLGAGVAVILGEDEVAVETAIVRDLGRGEQAEVPLDEVPAYVARLITPPERG